MTTNKQDDTLLDFLRSTVLIAMISNRTARADAEVILDYYVNQKILRVLSELGEEAENYDIGVDKNIVIRRAVPLSAIQAKRKEYESE